MAAAGNMELMHECFPKHSRMGTARINYDKQVKKVTRTTGVSMERRKAGARK